MSSLGYLQEKKWLRGSYSTKNPTVVWVITQQKLHPWICCLPSFTIETFLCSNCLPLIWPQGGDVWTSQLKKKCLFSVCMCTCSPCAPLPQCQSGGQRTTWGIWSPFYHVNSREHLHFLRYLTNTNLVTFWPFLSLYISLTNSSEPISFF